VAASPWIRDAGSASAYPQQQIIYSTAATAAAVAAGPWIRLPPASPDPPSPHAAVGACAWGWPAPEGGDFGCGESDGRLNAGEAVDIELHFCWADERSFSPPNVLDAGGF
jgi:hypothetical protein